MKQERAHLVNMHFTAIVASSRIKREVRVPSAERTSADTANDSGPMLHRWVFGLDLPIPVCLKPEGQTDPASLLDSVSSQK